MGRAARLNTANSEGRVTWPRTAGVDQDTSPFVWTRPWLPRAEQPLRVIAWPAFVNRQQNPYNALLYGELAALGVRVDDFFPHRLLFGRYDIWHLHWPESILNLPRPWQALPLALVLRFLLRVARVRGIKIVWTAHNLQSHEGRYPRVEARLWQALLGQVDAFIALTELGKRQALRRFPVLRGRPAFVIPHGPYRSCYADTISPRQAREHLGLPPAARVIVSLGQIRPYKNLPHLIRTFRQLPDHSARLLIVGQADDPALVAELRAAAAGDPRVRLGLAFIPPDEMQIYLRAADLVALPYREVLNSGSALLALSFARPVLIPARGAMNELRQEMGNEWVRTYHGALHPTTLAEALRWATDIPRDPARLFPGLSWDMIALQTLRAYRTLDA